MKLRIITAFIVLILIISTSSTVFADAITGDLYTNDDTIQEEISKEIFRMDSNRIKNLPAEQLLMAAQFANTEYQAYKVFEALLDKVENGQLSISAVINTYISIVNSSIKWK